jgi:hypothetical protein
MVGSPAIFEAFVAIERRGGSEDPWLCVAGFGQLYLCRRIYPALLGDIVNSGKYAAMSAWGSLAVVRTHSSSMTGLRWKADIHPRRMTALINTGQSEVLKLPKLDGSYRPEADAASSQFSNSTNALRRDALTSFRLGLPLVRNRIFEANEL